MERLSLWRTNVYHSESCRKIRTRLASICWNITAYVNKRKRYRSSLAYLSDSPIWYFYYDTYWSTKNPSLFFLLSATISKKRRFEFEGLVSFPALFILDFFFFVVQNDNKLGNCEEFV